VVPQPIEDRGGEDFVAAELAPLAEALFEVSTVEPFSYLFENACNFSALVTVSAHTYVTRTQASAWRQ